MVRIGRPIRSAGWPRIGARPIAALRAPDFAFERFARELLPFGLLLRREQGLKLLISTRAERLHFFSHFRAVAALGCSLHEAAGFTLRGLFDTFDLVLLFTGQIQSLCNLWIAQGPKAALL